MAIVRHPREPLPKAHFSTVTWVALVTVAVMVALYVAWAVWFREPTFMF